jgi:outer membrane protein W
MANQSCSRSVLAALFALFVCATSSPAHAESAVTFRTRALATGSSSHSDPAGYTVYSAFTLEAGLALALHRLFAVELDVRTESHEVDGPNPAGGRDLRLGSIDLLPVNLIAQWHPFPEGSLHPYAGAGLNMTLCWEKSGLLDDTRVTPGFGPAAQLGLDVDLSSVVLLNFDLRWNLYRPSLETGGQHVASLHVDPISLGVGLGFRI